MQAHPLDQYEVIVTDDSPPGESMERLVRERFPWARWVPGARRGPAANRNHGAAQARGEWLVFTDDDCLPAKEWLRAFAAHVGDHPKAEVLEGRTNTGGIACGSFETAPVNETGGFLWSCNLAIRRSLFDAIGGFDENFPSAHMEDVDLRWRLRERGSRVEFVADALVVHPPRPISGLWKDTRKNEANVYFARKHGVSVAEAGLSIGVVARICLRNWQGCRGFSDSLRMTTRNLGWVLLTALQLPAWLWRYRSLANLPRRSSTHWGKSSP